MPSHLLSHGASGRGEVSLGRAFNVRGSMSTAADEPAPRSSRAQPTPWISYAAHPGSCAAFEDQGSIKIGIKELGNSSLRC